MTKQNVIGITILGVTLLGILGGSIWWGMKPKHNTATHVQSASTTSSTLSDDGPSSLNTTSSSGIPLGNATDGSGIQTNLGQQGGVSGNSNNTQGQANKSSGGNASAKTIDPKTFTEYDKYKNEPNALFAEITPGTGAVAEAGKTIAVSYQGWLTNGQTFDQNISPAKPFSFVLGAHSVIPGWEQDIAGMKEGGERLLIIPPAVGYGAQGQGSIPPNAVLVFYVKILSVK
jgi:FKBP-type peptidyl-prolyl cis-trans isomerase